MATATAKSAIERFATLKSLIRNTGNTRLPQSAMYLWAEDFSNMLMFFENAVKRSDFLS